jgi:predicted AAA+ superfamily ATPase
MIARQNYLARLRLLKDQKLIKVVTGIRRSGKSTLLQLFRSELEKDGVKKRQIQSYNYEDPAANENLDWRDIYNQIAKKILPKVQNYIFLDEIQTVPKFEKLVNGLFIKKNVDLYITGSNAFLLSGELATLLTGRYISLHLLPFSFAEYRQVFPNEPNKDRLFEKYLSASSFPEAVNLAKTNSQLANNYLKDLYLTIINRDIARRYEIRGKDDFERVVKFIFSEIGSPISARKIASALSIKPSATIAHATILRYLDYLVKSYLIYPISRYDLRGKKLLTTNDKYYAVDLGLRSILLGSSPKSDLGHRLENVVYLELLRRNQGEIWVGKTENNEVDFIVQKSGGARIYYQVAYQVNDRPKTLARELTPFRKLKDNYPKILLTTDLVAEEFEGIRKINVVDWLLEET